MKSKHEVYSDLSDYLAKAIKLYTRYINTVMPTMAATILNEHYIAKAKAEICFDILRMPGKFNHYYDTIRNRTF